MASSFKDFLQKINHKYRVSVMNDATLEEKVAFRLSRLDVAIVLGSIMLISLVFTLISIIYTPLKEYIPGYQDLSLRKELVEIQAKTDSMSKISYARAQYLEDIRLILAGKIDSLPQSSILVSGSDEKDYSNISFSQRSKEDSLLREEVEKIEDFSLYNADNQGIKKDEASLHLINPTQGVLTSEFKPSEGHFGIDIVSNEQEAIKSVMDGRVIFTSWTLETGYVIIVQHPNDLVSFYKHNSVLLKKVGNLVSTGDVIALMGSSGENSTGPHLHFELWKNQNAIDPQLFFNYK